MKKINDMTEGDLVTNGSDEYAKVKFCNHGNPYYAYIGTKSNAEQMDYTEEDIESAEIVSDWYDVNVNECCG